MSEVWYWCYVHCIFNLSSKKLNNNFVSVPPRYDPVFRLSPPPPVNTFPCLIDPSEGAFEAFDIEPK